MLEAIEIKDEEIEERTEKVVKLEKKYLRSWASGRIKKDRKGSMDSLRANLVSDFEEYCDMEKFKFYLQCGETRNFFRKS